MTAPADAAKTLGVPMSAMEYAAESLSSMQSHRLFFLELEEFNQVTRWIF